VAHPGLAPDGPSSSNVHNVWTSPLLDGDVYAQPLIVGDRVIIATGNDTVYALDASSGSIQWQRHLGEPIASSSLPCGNVDPVGITSTPVVDAAAGRIYAVGMVQPGQHVLFDLDLSSGEVMGTTRVDVANADPAVHNQRGALALSNGKLFIPYGGRFGDCGDYRGRLVSVAVSPSGLGAVASYTLPTQGEGGWWAPPGPVVASDGSLFLASGNSASSGTFDYGNSVVRLSPDLTLVDAFAPSNWAALNSTDGDLGATSPVLLPDNRVFQVGKAGIGYLLDATHLGGIGGELRSVRVCNSRAFGGVAHDGNTMFVPCSSGVAQVTASGNDLTVRWTASASIPGPTIIAGGAVWTVATGSGDLLALDPASGKTLTTQHIGRVPSQFTSATAGGGRVVVAAERKVMAFGT
jgi:outer membrane protein assembly factor BamB